MTKLHGSRALTATAGVLLLGATFSACSLFGGSGSGTPQPGSLSTLGLGGTASPFGSIGVSWATATEGSPKASASDVALASGTALATDPVTTGPTATPLSATPLPATPLPATPLPATPPPATPRPATPRPA